MSAAPLLLNIFPAIGTGGVHTRFLTLANHFGRALRHVIVAMDGNYACAEQLAASLDVACYRVPVRKGRLTTNRTAFRRGLQEIRPDILVTHNWGTIEWAFANFPRVSRHVHIEDGFGPDELDRQFLRRVWARRLALRRSTVVVPSRNLYRIAREAWRLPEHRIRYIPNGIDCARFDGAPDPEILRSWPGNGPVIGTVAALRAEKNLARLLRAFAMIAKDIPCRLVIVGDGAERNRLQSLLADLGLQHRVTFLGHVADPHRLYSEFDIFALTSDTEQMPYTVLEAMAAGRAIVATDVGDISVMVAPSNRPYIVACDDNAVAEALRQLMADKTLRHQIGEANRQRALAEYDQARMFEAFSQLFGLAPDKRR
jgi:glycosyltransferase involved in cell wall biosynthesis